MFERNLKCVICGKMFIYLIDTKNKIRETCSSECLRELKGRIRRRKIKTHCSYCGKPLERIPSHMKAYETHFCNLICLGKYYRGKKRGGRKKGVRCSKETEFKKGSHPNLKGEFKPGHRDQRKRWLNDDYMFKVFNGMLFGKGHIPNALDKKVIEAKILISKIQRSINNGSGQKAGRSC